MPHIQRLSQSLINKIAAGEVIERPASVVKELVENSVDAGATRIDVSVQGGGMEMIRISDNGCGIAADELELAIASHATSKLADADDLFRVHTLGFRGEALASIAEISRMVIRSRTPDSEGGAEIEVVGGKASPVVPVGCPVGTTIEVYNLFFNTPVRRKFLRSTQTELGHVSEAFTRIAMPLPQLHFTLRHNERPMFELPGAESWLERIGRLFGNDLAGALLAVESNDGPIRLSGYAAYPTHSRSNNRMQYLFLNHRFIRDRSLQHALGEAYRGLLMTGRFPVAFLAIEMPPEDVDVNVHPTKLEVRFQDSGRIYSQLLSTLRSKFLTTDLTPRVQAPSGLEDPTGAHDEVQAVQMRQQVVDWAKGQMTAWPSAGARGPSPVLTDEGVREVMPVDRGPLEINRLDRSWAPAHSDESDWPNDRPAMSEPPSPPLPCDAGIPLSRSAPLPSRSPQALQLHDRYLVAESDDGMMVIDQHALHERILYELLRHRIEAGSLESQTLLVPEPVDLPPAEAAVAVDNRELLAQLGVKIEPFGGDTVLVSSYPAMLRKMKPSEVLHGLVDHIQAGGKTLDRRVLFDELLHTIACKAAIKAGDPLTPAEISALLEQRHLIDDSHHCPHGRPTALVFTREELDKQFKRV